MSRSDDERVADIIDAAHELASVVQVGIGEASGSLSDKFKQAHPGRLRHGSTNPHHTAGRIRRR